MEEQKRILGPEEQFVLDWFGLKDEATDECTKINTDYGVLVNMLTMFNANKK